MAKDFIQKLTRMEDAALEKSDLTARFSLSQNDRGVDPGAQGLFLRFPLLDYCLLEFDDPN